MAQHREIVDQLIDLLAAPDPALPEAANDWAEAYADLCRQANDRLRKCDDTLRRGLRGDTNLVLPNGIEVAKVTLVSNPPN